MTVLVAAAAGPLRDSLIVFLKTLSQVGGVCVADNLASAQEICHKHQPRLVVLDGNLVDATDPSMRRLFALGRQRSRCLVLANDRQQQEAALASGADEALVKGHPAASFFETVQQLLLQPIEVAGSTQPYHGEYIV